MKHKLILLLLLFVIFYSCDSKNTYSERKITEIQFEEVSKFEYEDGKVIRMTADNNYIYLSSYPDNTIQVFEYNGKHIKTIGKSGEAPWENGSIWSFGQDSTSYWLHDYPKMAFKKYDKNTDTLLHFQRYITKHNVLYAENDRFIVPSFDDKIGIFYISLYDALNDSVLKKTDICNLSGKFKKLPPYGDFTFQGDFCKNSKGQSVYFCMYNSSFYFIDKHFNKVTYHNDVRNLPISNPIISNDMIKLNPENAGIIAGTMDDKYIYFLAPKYKASKINKALKDFLIDVYDINTKKYLISFELPHVTAKINRIAKTDRGFIISDYQGYVYVYNNSFVQIIDKIANTNIK